MKRTISFVLTVALLLSTAAVGFAAPSKVTVWCWDPNFNGYAMKQAALVYNKMKPDVTIDIVDFPNSDAVMQKMQAAMQAGGAGLPDVALVQDFQIEQLIENYPGVLADMKAAGVDFTQFATYKVGPMTQGSKIYGIPFDSGSTGLFLRADYLKQAGLDPAKYQKNMTWTEVTALGKIVKAKINKPLIAFDSTDWTFVRMMAQSAGAQWFNTSGKLDLTNAAIRPAIATLKSMYDAGILYPTEGWNNWVSAFNNGDAGGLMSAVWIVGTIKSQPTNAGKWMVVPTPSLDGVKGAQNASNWGGSSWYVFDKAPNKAGAIDFMKSVWASKDAAALGFYNTILKGAGAMGTYLPSGKGSNYTAADEFFYNKQAVFGDFAKWMANVPALRYTANYNAWGSAISASLAKMYKGELKTPDDVLKDATTVYEQTISQ
ncbi:MAG: hypothetical protein WCG80_15125 [Spirochaetales bacterium]